MNGDNENHVLFPTKHTQRAMAVVGGRGGCVPPDEGACAVAAIRGRPGGGLISIAEKLLSQKHYTTICLAVEK